MKPYCILIPFHNPWDWHTDYANQTATLLAKRHTVVCLLWGDAVSLRELLRGSKRYRPITKRGSLYTMQPLFLIPGKRFLAVQFANMFLNLIVVHLVCSLLAIRHNRTKLFWFFGYYDPVFLLLPPFFRHWKTVYDCVDIATHPDPKLSRLIQTSQQRLLTYAWQVFANSDTLTKRLRRMRQDVIHVPLGFRIEAFRHPTTYALPLSRKHPIIGYVGSMDYRLDLPLLIAIITKHPTWQFALVGPVFYDHLTPKNKTRMDTILHLPNVYHTIIRPSQVPSVLSHCSVTILPYDLSVPLGRFAFPMKVMEYFYAQKPIVATPIPELGLYAPWILQGSSASSWHALLAHAIRHPPTPLQKRQERAIALRNTWDKKMQRILCLLDARSAPSDRTKRFMGKARR